MRGAARIAANMAGVILLLVSHLPSAAAQSQISQAAPQKKDRRYSIAMENQEMIIDPQKGGRIASLLMDGADFLTDSTANDFNWGSTFWFSPQHDWHWPPAAQIDNLPYQVTVENNAMVMTSAPDPKTGLVVTKTISSESSHEVFVVQYTITNHSAAPRKVAPWEVTRVRPKGLAFFPAGQGAARGGLLPSTRLEHNVYWYTYDTQKLPLKGDRQLYADGSEGWLAQINDRYILIKKFPDISPETTAPEEGEVELYASEVTPANPGYVEIEHQGAYTTLKPGASLTWTCTWIFRKLPAGLQPITGNKALVEYVRKLVRG